MKTILFVDDEPWYHEAIRVTLESRGYKCLSVTDMTAGLDVMATNEVSVVVTDIMMPPGKNFAEIDSQETGIHFIDRVRAEWPQTAIVCLSVIGDAAKIGRIRNLNVDYLRKGEAPLATVVQTIETAAGDRKGKVWRF